MRDCFWEKTSLAVSLLVVAGSSIITGIVTIPRDAIPTAPRAEALGLRANAALIASDGSESVLIPWRSPAALSHADAWAYELFGPPTLSYDNALQRYVIASADTEKRGKDDASSSGLELVSVRRAPFRLQLVGYIGEGEGAAGTFVNLKTGETFVARTGHEMPELGLTIANFNVGQQPGGITESTTSLEPVARADVRDMSNGEVVVLTNREWMHEESLLAKLRLDGDAGPTLEVREGDVIHSAPDHFQVVKIRLNPPAVDMARLAADKTVAGQLTLVPVPNQTATESDSAAPP